MMRDGRVVGDGEVVEGCVVGLVLVLVLVGGGEVEGGEEVVVSDSV